MIDPLTIPLQLTAWDTAEAHLQRSRIAVLLRDAAMRSNRSRKGWMTRRKNAAG